MNPTRTTRTTPVNRAPRRRRADLPPPPQADTTTTTTTPAASATTTTATSTSPVTTTSTAIATPGRPSGADFKSPARRYFEAARARDHAAIQALLATKVDINECDKKGSALHRLAQAGDAQGIRLLCQREALTGTCDEQGRTPLMVAARHAKPEALAALLECGAKQSAKAIDRAGRTALYHAVKANCMACVEQLCQCDIPLDACGGKRRWGALHWAAAKGKLEVVKKLVECNAQVDLGSSDGSATPFLLAAAAGHTPILLYLKEQGCNTRYCERHRKMDAMCHAASGGHLDVILTLQSWGIPVDGSQNGKRNTPLKSAADHDQAAAMRLLVKLGAARPEKNALLAMCIRLGNVKAAELLLDWGDDPKLPLAHMGATYMALWLASWCPNADMVRLLLARGAELQHETYDPPLLIQAAWHGRVKTLALLLDECKLDINGFTRKNSMTALMSAACAGHLPAVKFLVQRGAKLDLALGDPPKTAITMAAINCNTDVVRELRMHGQTPQWRHMPSAMQNAIKVGRAGMVEILLEAGYLPSSADLQAAICNANPKALVIDLIMPQLVEEDRPALSPETLLDGLLNKFQGELLFWLALHDIPAGLWPLLNEVLKAYIDILPYASNEPPASENQGRAWLSCLLLEAKSPNYDSIYLIKEHGQAAEEVAQHAQTRRSRINALAEEMLTRVCLRGMESLQGFCISNVMVQTREAIVRTVHAQTSLLMPLANNFSDCWISAVKKAFAEAPPGALDPRNNPEPLYLRYLVEELDCLLGHGVSAFLPPGPLPSAYFEVINQQLRMIAMYRESLRTRAGVRPQPQEHV